MLVLARKNGQKIIINDNIEITILDTRVDYCKIAINAPNEVKIYREEIYKQIQQTNEMSNKASVETLNSLTSMLKDNIDVKEKPNKIIIKKKES